MRYAIHKTPERKHFDKIKAILTCVRAASVADVPPEYYWTRNFNAAEGQQIALQLVQVAGDNKRFDAVLDGFKQEAVARSLSEKR